jgi:hypothetical protein
MDEGVIVSVVHLLSTRDLPVIKPSVCSQTKGILGWWADLPRDVERNELERIA